MLRFTNTTPPNLGAVFSEHYELGAIVQNKSSDEKVTDILIRGLRDAKNIGLQRPIQYFDIISICTCDSVFSADSGVKAASFLVIPLSYASSKCPGNVKLYGHKLAADYVVAAISPANPILSFREE